MIVASAPAWASEAEGGQNDANSGRDAPAAPVPAVTVQPRVVYHGQLGGAIIDLRDHFAFHAGAQQVIQMEAFGTLNCPLIVDGAGTPIDDQWCVRTQRANQGVSATLPEAGVYFLAFASDVPAEFSFVFALDQPAPPLGPLA